ncbi:sugar phosphate nucleotidyltransferase [Pelagibacteraceae bacterium]|jgi:glucose-1-phosphate cytidylyltransferase|nr:sugar phosphate nucleotidyltransferase [Pelagibacteraceae bacterium]MDC0952913.1 sugar phosphate nucleotidyltransferase [Pelagibacteraceae bacterium]|tara:strand:- start:1109 stop:1837 length:729 start_codon:yes stop_codon:yes gene_type:complete
MKVIILAGGKGTRISEYTKTIPKPMIKIGKKPILIHIIEHYLKYGHRDFYVALGYKSKIVQKYFKEFKNFDKSFLYKINKNKVNITLTNTGKNTLTGGRIKRMSKFIKKDENFMFTYGDGVSNVNINNLIKFHKKNKNLITVTAVRPPARFGEITINNNCVSSFKEKPQVTEGWINGGFFITNFNFFKLIKGNNTILEKEPLEKAAKKKQLFAFKHKGFWKCMDTLRDKDVLEKIFKINRFN